MRRKRVKNRPFFSIIVPSYNQDEYLKENLKSIESQSYTDWEVIIMDGGSKDESTRYIKEFAKRNTGKVQWRSAKDAGQVWAINEGIRRASGDVISYLNSDDMYLKDTLKHVAKKMNHDCKWLYGGCEASKKSLQWTFFYKKLWPIRLIPKLIYVLNPVNQPSVFMKAKFVKKIGLFDENFKLAFDYEYWIRCFAVAKPMYTPVNLSIFRIHKKAKGSINYHKQFEEELKALKKHKITGFLYRLHQIHNLLIVGVYSFLK